MPSWPGLFAMSLILASCAATQPSVTERSTIAVSPPPAAATAQQPAQQAQSVATPPAKPTAQRPASSASATPSLKEVQPTGNEPAVVTKPEFAWVNLASTVGANQAQSLFHHLPKEFNTIEAHDPRLLDQLVQKWNAAKSERMTILHFGDSHVQGGPAAQFARHKLQSVAGNAGRGMVFPYAIAKTYSQNDFKSSFQGEWITANSIQVYPKLPLGVSGFVAQTKSKEASFTLEFNQQFDPGAKSIHLFHRTTAPGYQIRMSSGRWVWESGSITNASDTPQVTVIEVPQLHDVIRFELVKPDQGSDEDLFELHGINIENKLPGVLYHNLGVGGSAFGSLLAQSHFESQSALLKPDLVILDWGTNDLIYKNRVSPQLEQTISDTIQKVRSKHPGALILLTSVQDTYFKKHEVTSTWNFSVLLRKIAKDNDCLFYDWYRIAGARDAMRTWYAYGLAQPDHVHLTSMGYAIKGELLAQAMMNAMDLNAKNPKSSLWMEPQQKESPRSVSAWLKSTHPFERRPDLIRAGGKASKPAAESQKTHAKTSPKKVKAKPKKAG